MPSLTEGLELSPQNTGLVLVGAAFIQAPADRILIVKYINARLDTGAGGATRQLQAYVVDGGGNLYWMGHSVYAHPASTSVSYIFYPGAVKGTTPVGEADRLAIDMPMPQELKLYPSWKLQFYEEKAISAAGDFFNVTAFVESQHLAVSYA